MATRAEEYRAAAERSGPKKAKTTVKRPTAGRLSHNDAKRVDHKSTRAIEPRGARPSRKSTRDSSNRSKPDSAQRITVSSQNATAKARHTRGGGQAM
jgi:hypothetical protein